MPYIRLCKTVKRVLDWGWTHNKAAMKEYGLSLMSIELRLGGPNGSLIADDANVWKAIGGNTNTEIFFTGLTVKAQCKTLLNIN